MKTLAAVLVETGKPLVLDPLDIPKLKPGQVLVEIAYTGVCHTQLSEVRGHRGKDAFLPHCLGHEGSGIVMEIGPDVKKVRSGDRVLLSWMKGSGADVPGTIYQSAKLGAVNAGGITTFSEHAVISENRLTLVPDAVSLRDAALLGCAVPTGIGAVMNTARAQRGQSVVIFGTGGIGLCAVAGASLTECDPIVAVDVQQEKLDVARSLGATHCVRVNGGDLMDELKKIAAKFDIAIEATGRPSVMQQALQSVRDRGGVAVVLGNAKSGESMVIDPRELNQGKQLRGSWGGDNQPDRDFPRYFDYLSTGKLNVSKLHAQTYAMTEVNNAIDDLEAGRAVRPLIVINDK